MTDAATPDLLTDGPEGAAVTVILAHGAGAPMDSPFMETIAQGLAEGGLRVVRFEFPYMAERRRSGKRKPPNAARILEATWHAVIEAVGDPGSIVVGGKSMGGRFASMVADAAGVAGCVCLGYPFHPPGKPEKLRTAHLEALATPTLIVQGERDTFGTRDEVAGFALSPAIRCVWLPDGDHSLKPRVRSGHTEADNLATAVEEIVAFVSSLAS